MNTKLGLMGKTDTALLILLHFGSLYSYTLFLNPAAPGSLSLVWFYFSPVVTNLCYSRSHHITHMWLMAQCVLMCGIGGLSVCVGLNVFCLRVQMWAVRGGQVSWLTGSAGIEGPPFRSENQIFPLFLCFFHLTPSKTWERGMLYEANFWSIASNLQAERKE